MSDDARRTCELPSALDVLDALLAPARRTFVCLDYDGTLTPIVARPEMALLAPETRNLVSELAELCPTAVVSGRDRADVKARVGVPEAYYVGSHGFDVEGPEGSGVSLQIGAPYLEALDTVEALLRARTADVPGALVERKRYSIATHYRLVARDRVPGLCETVGHALDAFPTLRHEPGKEVLEVRPNVAWDKGKAVLWLADALGLDAALVMHVGDDLTDETVFAVLDDRGAGVFVGEEDRATAARYRLRDPREVAELIRRLIVALRGRTTGRAGRTGG
jgi:alpha,alpha-trehalase